MDTLTQDERNFLFNTACSAARQSGSILKSHFGKQKKVSYKAELIW